MGVKVRKVGLWVKRHVPWAWRFWRRNRRTCLGCGFLGYEGGEAKQGVRQTVAAGGSSGWFENDGAVNCYKGFWSWDGMEAGLPAYEVASDEAHSLRYRCPGYFPYVAGRGPLEHLKLEDERREFRRKLHIWLLGALTTGLIALAGYFNRPAGK